VGFNGKGPVVKKRDWRKTGETMNLTLTQATDLMYFKSFFMPTVER
jgi:hypothetical protein